MRASLDLGNVGYMEFFVENGPPMVGKGDGRNRVDGVFYRGKKFIT
jgi:hypothetical protein